MSTPSFENMKVQPTEPVPTAHELLVDAEAKVLRARAEARERVAAEVAASEAETAPLLVDGGTFLLDIPQGVPAVYGAGNAVVWPRGESCMVCGPPGTGKTTFVSQVVLCGLGIGGPTVLGLPVAPMRRVLYMAMDRPQQIARAMARRVTDADREVLAERLVVWKGPPPADLAKQPGRLLALAQEADADVVVVDSLKDAAIGLSEDEVGAGYNRARQLVLAAGIELIELHHTRKPAPGGAAPGLSDVYGSTWLTSGAGSVLMLDGQAGDPVITFRHLKQPAGEVGPWRLLHDQAAGEMTVQHSTDLVAVARAAGPGGLSARAAAVAVFEKNNPTRSDVEKARRRLDTLTRSGDLVAREGVRGGEQGGEPTVWFEAFTGLGSDHGGDHAGASRPTDHDSENRSRQKASSQVRGDHGTDHGDHAPSDHVSHHPLRVGSEPEPDDEQALETLHDLLGATQVGAA